MTNVDTNYFLRWLLGDIADQADQANAFLQGSENNSVNLTSAVLAEIIYGLRSYGYERNRIALTLLAVLELECLACDKTVYSKAVELFGSTTLDFVDCYLVADAVTHQRQLKTFDKKMQLAYLNIQKS
jgi:predicted nucleic acid-binding protein